MKYETHLEQIWRLILLHENSMQSYEHKWDQAVNSGVNNSAKTLQFRTAYVVEAGFDTHRFSFIKTPCNAENTDEQRMF